MVSHLLNMYSDAETMRCIGSDLLGSMCLQVREWYTAYVLCAHVNELCLSTSDHYLCAKWSLFLRRLVFVCRHNRNRIAKWKIYLPKHVATPRGIWVECRYILLGNSVFIVISANCRCLPDGEWMHLPRCDNNLRAVNMCENRLMLIHQSHKCTVYIFASR